MLLSITFSCVKNKECKDGSQPDFTGNYIVQVMYESNTTTYSGWQTPTGSIKRDTTYVDTMNISCVNCPDELIISHFPDYPTHKQTKTFITKRFILKDEAGKHSIFKKQKVNTCKEENRANTINDDDYLVLRNDSLIFKSKHSYKTYSENKYIKGKRIN